MMTLEQLTQAVDAAFGVAAESENLRHSITIPEEGVRICVNTYTSPNGSGFEVVGTLNMGWHTVRIVRQQGPEAYRERPAPSPESLLKECQKARAARYEAEASVYDLADAETKIASSNPVVQAEGAAQKTAVLARRLAIKAEIPKPQ